ncbi:MAG: hypothetical protein ISP90_10185 [Nevskia sp.]|nr:hypothetical protein [Nevskia sp.]
MDFFVRLGTSGQHHLELNGSCRNPHWITALFQGLSDHRISIVSGHVTLGPQHEWHGRFHLDCAECRIDVSRIDYSGMTERTTSALLVSEAPLLSTFSVTRRADQSLELRIDAPDQRGFLGRILARISGLGLFPVSMDIGTVNGRINDRLVFRGIGGMAPGEPVAKALDTLLNRFTPQQGRAVPA